MPAIFISHSSLDNEICGPIKASLEDWGYEQIFLDFDKVTGISVGENWENRLYEELSRAHAVILILTQNWADSKWCFVEYAQARALGKTILPILCDPLVKSAIFPGIQVLNALNLNEKSYEELERRLLAISNELARGFVLAPHRLPYPGFHAFEAEDAAIFFGRDEETRAVIERLDARRNQGGTRFIVLIGASGSGKSSLLRAGVLPQLGRRRSDWHLLPPIRPERFPVEAIAKAIAQQGVGPGDWRIWHQKLIGLDAIMHIEELLKDLRIKQAKAATILLPIDQLEEAFTIAVPQERDAFIRLLSCALDPKRQLPLMAIATARSDVLQELLEHDNLAQLSETLPLSPIPLERVYRLVEGPAAVAGLNVEKGLSELIIHDLENPEALPLLAYALHLLYRRSIEHKKLTINNYQQLGDVTHGLNPVQDAVHQVADLAVGTLNASEEELEALRRAFIPHLVRVRLDDGQRVRRPARLADLPLNSRRLIRALVDARLLSVRGGTYGGSNNTLVEVAHEALFKAWPTLDRWLNEEQGFLSDLARLQAALEIWSQASPSHKASALLHGLLLTRARDWLDRYPERFVGHEMNGLRSFILRSAEAEALERSRIEAGEAKTRRLEQRLIRGALLAALIFAVIAVLAIGQYFQAEQSRQTAERQRNEALLTQSRFLANLAVKQEAIGDNGTAIGLSLEALPDRLSAYDRPYLAAAESILYQSIIDLRERGVLRGHKAEVRSATFSRNGQLLLTASWDRTARVWDPSDLGKAVVLEGHTDRLEDASFSTDGLRVATASWDRTARIWDSSSGRQMAVLKGHGGGLNTAVFSPDNSRLVTASKDGTARVWGVATSEQLFVLRGHTAEVYTAVFSPNGRQILTASADQNAAIWDSDNGHQVVVLSGHDGEVFNAAFSPDGKRVVTASLDRTARVWNADDGALLTVLQGHDDVVLVAEFSPDGRRIVTAAGNVAKVWDVVSGTLILELHGHENLVVAAAFSPDGRRIVTSSGDNTARIWDAADGTELAVLRGHNGWIYSAVFSPDGERVVTASLDGTARIWAASVPEVKVLKGHNDAVSAVAVSSDGRRVITGSDDRTARIWDTSNGAEIATLARHLDRISAVAFSPSGQSVATTSWDNTTRIWDASNGTELTVLQGHGDRVNTVAYSPDGQRLVTASWDKSARIWDAANAIEVTVLWGHTKLITSAAFSPDSTRVVTASQDDTARIWNAASGAEIAVLRGHTNWVLLASFSPNGKRVVTASQDGTARIWDAENGSPLVVLRGHDDQVETAAFSPDGQLVVTGSWDNTARIWNATTGAVVSILRGHENRVEAAAFFADGKRVITASWDKTARIWDLASGETVAVLKGHSDQIRTVMVSPTARWVITASDDKTARIWPVFATTQALVEYARRVMPRELSSRQREEFSLPSP